MKKFDKLSFIVCCTLFITTTLPSFSQGLYKVNVEEKVAGSTVILEGKVISQESFWNAAHTMIYTSNKIEVYKVFKGAVVKNQIEILTQGGTVGLNHVNVSDLLSLSKDEVGVFFCFPNRVNLRSPSSGDLLLEVYSSSQGFLSYDLTHQSASAPFVNIPSINSLYTDLIARNGRSFENRKPDFKVEDFALQPNAPLAPVITSFSPTTVNAGATIDVANNELVITGSGFGTPTGTAAVLFDDANNGTGGTPFTVLATDNTVVSWTDTEIRIKTPSRAGTGTFSVRDAAGVSGSSPTPLNVFFSILTATFSDGINTRTKEANLMNQNGTGGYTIHYSTSTAGGGRNFNTAAEKASFQRALTTWREVNGVNFSEGLTTITQLVNVGNDSNLVMFDNTNTGVPPLAAGTLAVCYSFFSGCTPVTTNAYQKTEFDIVVRNPGVSVGSTTFSIGPCPPLASNASEIDLETVLLHELGHALNLGHINDSWEGSAAGELNPNKVMNFAVVNSVKRVSPDISAYLGTFYAITPQANPYGLCGLYTAEMIPLTPIVETRDNCPSSFPTSSIVANTTVTFDLVHATSNKFSDPNFAQADCDPSLDGVGLTNNAFYAFRTNSAGGIVTINVTGYTTTPAAPGTCPTPYPFPTKGIELLVYQVGSCPTGQAYPAPVACRQFDANGALANLSGLAANTSYLIMVDGIENTKANFNLTFTGGALPINLSDFAGEVLADHNRLNWTIDYARDVKSVFLQRSADGISFETVAEVTGSVLAKKGSYDDKRPNTGSNYYRLAISNNDDSKEYSKVVLLKRKDALLVNVFPNPARQVLNIEINASKTGKYSVQLHNNVGQLISAREVLVTGGRQLTTLNVNKFAPGLYNITVYDDKKQIVKAERITIQ